MIDAGRIIDCAWEIAGASLTLNDAMEVAPGLLDNVKKMNPNTFSQELDEAIDKVRAVELMMSDIRSSLIEIKKEWIKQMQDD